MASGKSTEYFFEIIRDEDINECVEIITKPMGEARVNKEAVKQRLKDPNFMTVVGKSGRNIKGLINVLIPPNFVQPPKIILISVADQESAVKGLFGMLIDEFINELRRRFPKIPALEVELSSRDTNAVAMYSSKGFSVEGFIRGGLGNTDLIVLRKRLSQDSSGTPIA